MVPDLENRLAEEEPGKPGTDQARMTIIEHLEELRRRLIISLVAVTGGAVVGWFLVPGVLTFLSRPVGRLVFVAPTEAFFSYLKLAVIIGVVLGAPVVLVEAWLFILPGLYPHEVKFFRRYIPLIIGLFVGGVLFALFVVFPVVMHFFLAFQQGKVRAMMNIGRYLNFLTALLLPFGFIFEFPLVIVILVKLGIFSQEALRRGRRFAYLLIFVAAALLTPPDVVSQLLMALPLLLLYEMGLWLTKGMKPVQETWPEKPEEEESEPGGKG